MSIYSVLDFGANGDGVTDSTAAFHATFAAAIAGGGGVIRIPPGKFVVNGTIGIDRRVRLDIKGEGLCSEILWSFDGDLFYVPYGISFEESSFRDIRITSVGAKNPESCAIRCYGGVVRSTFDGLVNIPRQSRGH